MDHLASLGAQTAALAAAVMAGLYLFRKARKAFQWIETVHRITTRELTHNHGSSMKDDTHGLAVALGEVQRRMDDLETDFRTHLRDSLEAQRAATEHATDALARSAPATPERKGRAW